MLEDLSVSEYLALRAGTDRYPDSVHKNLCLGPLATELLCTPPVQRLRGLYQLGATSFWFRSAEHSRLPHSLGTAHLAHEHVRLLAAKQPMLEVSALDMQLLEVAGLCHDIGHGPFSHLFESEFLPAVLPPGSTPWKHEVMSMKLLEHAVDTAYIDIDRQHVRQLQDIIGSGSLPRQLHWDIDREWQLQIVANDVSSVDVDKLDYLMRDALMAGVPHSYDFTPLLHSSKVIGGDICFHASMQHMLGSLFDARKNMHLDVYQHRQAKAAEYMLVDCLKAANLVLRISDQIHTPEDFLQLRDSVIDVIRVMARAEPADANLARATAVLRRLDSRDFYPFVAEVAVPDEVVLHEEQQPYKLVTVGEVLSWQDHNSGVMLTEDDILVHNMKVDHCKGRDDPMKFVHLFNSDVTTFPATTGLMRPAVFLQRKVRIYLRRDCASSCEQQAYIAAALTAFSRAMRRPERFGPSCKVLSDACSSGSTSGRKLQRQLLLEQLLAQRRHQQQQQQQQHLVAVTAEQSWSQWRQQSQQQGGSADADVSDYVPATDSEEDVQDDVEAAGYPLASSSRATAAAQAVAAAAAAGTVAKQAVLATKAGTGGKSPLCSLHMASQHSTEEAQMAFLG